MSDPVNAYNEESCMAMVNSIKDTCQCQGLFSFVTVMLAGACKSSPTSGLDYFKKELIDCIKSTTEESICSALNGDWT